MGDGACYSSFRFKTSITSPFTLERDDGDVQTIAFNGSGWAETDSLMGNAQTFSVWIAAGGGECRATTVIDQSNNGNNTTHAYADSPVFATGGAIVRVDGMPALDWDSKPSPELPLRTFMTTRDLVFTLELHATTGGTLYMNTIVADNYLLTNSGSRSRTRQGAGLDVNTANFDPLLKRLTALKRFSGGNIIADQNNVGTTNASAVSALETTYRVFGTSKFVFALNYADTEFAETDAKFYEMRDVLYNQFFI